MKSKIGICIIMALALSLAACDTVRIGVREGTVLGSGKLATEQRPVSGVSEVVLTTVGTLVIDQTGQEGLSLEGEDNILPYITTEVKGGRLTIAAKPGSSFTTTKTLTYRLTVKSLTYIGNTASGEVVFN